MKKLFLTLIVSLALSGSIFAQHTSHWDSFNSGAFEIFDNIVAFIQIDGTFVEVTDNWADLEIASFHNDECRGHDFMVDWTSEGDPHPILEGFINYTNANEAITFQMYDHSSNTLYETCTVTLGSDPLEIVTGVEHTELYFDYDQCVIINFATPSTTLNDITWNVGGDWPGGSVPTGNVTIPDNTVVTIPAGYTANAGDITIGSGSSIVIEEGGYLFHTNDIPVTMQLNVQGYTKSNPTGYRLIAPPTYTVAADQSILATDVPNLITGTYDLYYFDGSQAGEEWRNYKLAANNFTHLFLKKGYLYANSGGAQLEFSGNTEPTAEMDIDLDYAATTWGGWNLIGNPYTCKAAVGKAFYVLVGTELISKDAGQLVEPMQGFFVKADATGEKAHLTPSTTSKAGASLSIAVSQANAMVDKAIVCFGSGDALEKFQLDPNHTKVYMPVEGRDYAVVSTGNQGEMPVSFKAESNGTYSLDFSSEDTEFSYLHLIDNMTGNDVDLLQTPSYSFNAQTTDYASRFRLVFATGTAGVDNFGFVCDGSIIINGNNGGTVQVIDALGRILVSENGVNSVSTSGMVPGVYVLRLINGNDVKTQKIVVK